MKSLFFILFLISTSAFCILPPIEIFRILKSGNGKSLKSAYVVNSVQEEYDFLDYLKVNIKMQKLIIIDGYFYDAITTNSKVIYFRQKSKKLQEKTKAK